VGRRYRKISEAKRIDDKIIQLAFYDATGGKLFSGMSDGLLTDLQSKISATFNRFKLLVRSGEFTLKELEDDVCKRNGAFDSDYEIKHKEKNRKNLKLKDHPGINTGNVLGQSSGLNEDNFYDSSQYDSSGLGEIDRNSHYNFEEAFRELEGILSSEEFSSTSFNKEEGKDSYLNRNEELDEIPLYDENEIADIISDFDSKKETKEGESFFSYLINYLINKRKRKGDDDGGLGSTAR
jgi:hypothetical protein